MSHPCYLPRFHPHLHLQCEPARTSLSHPNTLPPRATGMEGFQQACKLEDAPTPYPYAQIVSFAIWIFALTYPLLAASKAEGTLSDRAAWLAPAMSFVTVMAYFAFNEVARELEDPFTGPTDGWLLATRNLPLSARYSLLATHY